MRYHTGLGPPLGPGQHPDLDLTYTVKAETSASLGRADHVE